MSEINEIFAEVKAGVQQFRDEVSGLRDRMAEIEQKTIGQTMSNAVLRPNSIAAMVGSNAEFQAFRDRRIKAAGIRLTADMLLPQANVITNTGTRGDDVAQNTRMPGIVGGPERVRWVTDLMPRIPCAGPAVEYTKETSFINRAASQHDADSPTVTEGATKAQSDIVLGLQTAKLPTIAHTVNASRQVLDDQPLLQQYLNGRLVYGLRLETERQVIAGAGTGADMAGMTASGNHTVFTPATGDTAIDSINRALGLLETADYMPDAVILNPLDWRAIQRIKGIDDHYIVGNPLGAIEAGLWDCPVFATPSMPQGYFIAGALGQSTAFWVRQEAIVEASESHSDNFTRNLVTFRAELRAVVTVFHAAGIRYGALTL